MDFRHENMVFLAYFGHSDSHIEYANELNLHIFMKNSNCNKYEILRDMQYKLLTADSKICCPENKLAILAAILNMQISQICILLGRAQAEIYMNIWNQYNQNCGR